MSGLDSSWNAVNLPRIESQARRQEESCECPDCGTGRMVMKRGTYGEFMGCTNYPACRHTTGPLGQSRSFGQGRGTVPTEALSPERLITPTWRRVEILEELLTNAIERIESLEYYLEQETKDAA